MTDALNLTARPPATAPLTPARGPYGPAPGDDPEIENYDADFSELWQNPAEGMTFGDFLDIINPLQHIPIVSTIYRMVTGDEIGVGSRLAGGALFGGLPGLMAGALVAAFETAEGRSIESQIATLMDGDAPAEDPLGPGRQIAASATASTAGNPAAGPSETAGHAAVPAAGAALFTAKRPAAPVAVAPLGPAATPPPATPALGDAAGSAPPPPAAPEREARNDEPPSDKAADARERIAETLARTRAQQTALLLASLSPAPADTPKSRPDPEPPAAPAAETVPAAAARARPSPVRAGAAPATAPAEAGPPNDSFRTHPFMLGPGASPELISRAMEQALSKYHRGLQARGAAR